MLCIGYDATALEIGICALLKRPLCEALTRLFASPNSSSYTIYGSYLKWSYVQKHSKEFFFHSKVKVSLLVISDKLGLI